MPKYLVTTLAALLISACQQAPEPENGILAIRGGDLIAVKGNPLQDIALLQDVAVVVKGGEVLKLVTDRQT